MLPWIILFATFGSVGAIAGAGLLLLFPAAVRRLLLPFLLSYATGTLVGAAFLGMIPAGAAQAPVTAVSATVLGGIVLFFLLEKLVLWRHCHDAACDVHGSAAPLILVGDAFHNFVDGFVIAGGFLTSFPLGVAATLAVVAHEIPQEVGDFAILLDSGYGKLRALLLNLASSLATLPGAAIAYFFLAQTREAVPYILALSAASFIYIAMADLIPGLHRQVAFRSSLAQILLILAGIGTIALFRFTH